MIVVDSSAVVASLLQPSLKPELVARLDAEDEVHAPYLIDLEFLSALRRGVMRGWLTKPRAEAALTDYAGLALIRYAHLPLIDRVWQLRMNLSAYDAAFVALAEALDAPLVTCDRGLASSPGHRASIELYP